MSTVDVVPENTNGLPLGVSVEITTKDDTKYVVIHARLHVNKRFELPNCYSAKFSTYEILRDSSFLKYVNRYR